MARPDNLRVVVTGHTGLAKRSVLQTLHRHICETDAEWLASDPTSRAAIEERLVGTYFAEAGLGGMDTWLELNESARQDRWYESAWASIAPLRAETKRLPRYLFLALHVSYQWYSAFFSPLTWRYHRRGRAEDPLIEILKEFKPDYFVTLIDDIHVVQQSLRPGFHFRLRELMTWRNFETLLTDRLAQETIDARDFGSRYPSERSPIVAVRHPPRMLWRYLSEPSILRIYASYPISRPRKDHKEDEVNRFRTCLHEHFTVFDPVTIDERPLQMIHDAYRADSSVQSVDLPTSHQWLIPAEDTLRAEPRREVKGLRIDELREISEPQGNANLSVIDRSIEARDLRLIDQSDCLVVYRPFYGRADPASDGYKKAQSDGTRVEVQYAKRIAQKPVFIVHDPQHDGPIEPQTFDLEYGRSILIAEPNLGDPEIQKRVLAQLVTDLHAQAANITKPRLYEN